MVMMDVSAMKKETDDMDNGTQQAELAIIGACLLEEKIPDEIRGILSPEMFTSSHTVNVWKAIVEADQDDNPHYRLQSSFGERQTKSRPQAPG